MELPKKTPEYEELRELSGSLDLSYGPLVSRRLGNTLGVNLLGTADKVCSFDCPYCELGLTRVKMSYIKKSILYPTLAEIDSNLRNNILELTKNKTKIDAVALSGYGEPTLYPDFLEAVQAIKKIRDDLIPGVLLVALSNGSNLDDTKIVKAMNLLDESIIKLDAGNDEMFKKINSPLVRMSLAKLIQGTKNLTNVTLQAMFLQGSIDNTTPNEIDEWIEVVGIIRPKNVQLYTLDRVPAVSGLRQVPSQRLKEIAQLLLKRTQIKATVFA